MRFRLPQFAVYWAPSGATAFGRPAYATPVQLPCRWEDGVTVTLDAQGNEALSSATVYLATAVLATGAMMLGKLQDLGSGFPSDPKADPRVREIISAGNVPSLKNTQSLTTAKLK
jgi:hypothetical protein